MSRPCWPQTAKNRKLVVNDAEAHIVVEIYRRYLALKSVHALRDELADAGIKSKRRTRPDGAEYGGQTFSRGALYDPSEPALPRRDRT
jgi:site-specific DNA recombinase